MSVHGDSIYKDALREVPEWTVNGPLDTEELSVTNETLVAVYISADQSISAGTWETLALDTIGKDELHEFNPDTYQFIPDESGWYLISVGARFAVTADGDTIAVQFYNDTDGVVMLESFGPAYTAGDRIRMVLGVKELTEDETHIVRVRNNDSDDTIQSYNQNTFLQIRRMFR